MSVDPDKPVLYINILLHDASEAIHAKVREKLKARKSSLLPSVVQRVVPVVAGRFISDAKVVQKMSEQICIKVPSSLQSKGIRALADEVFREGPYLVVQLQVQHVDSGVILSKAHQQSEYGSNKAYVIGVVIIIVQWFFALIGLQRQQTVEETLLPSIVLNRLETAMNEVMEEKLIEKGVEAETLIVAEAGQARYFYEKLRQLRELPSNNSNVNTMNG